MSQHKKMAVDGALVWIDCEMTGLDPDHNEIIEIVCIITTGNLDVVDEAGWGTVVHQSKERMDQMDDWCIKTHKQSGLTDAVLASKVTPEQAADGLLAYIRSFVPEQRRALLAGNSVHADRAFLRKGPYRKVVEHLHYRILDVSSLKEAAWRWCPREVVRGAPVKLGLHQAREDILESIAEARYFKETIFQRRMGEEVRDKDKDMSTSTNSAPESERVVARPFQMGGAGLRVVKLPSDGRISRD